jgi:esterase/lipase superfamily enzyme
MGNRILLDSLREFSRRGAAPLTHVVLAAPDVDIDLFGAEVADTLGVSKSMTTYASAADKALALSTEVHGAARAGSAVIIIPGMDSVDASELDLGMLGHSYYADKLIQDMFYLFHHGFRADQRHLLARDNQQGRYWALPGFD